MNSMFACYLVSFIFRHFVLIGQKFSFKSDKATKKNHYQMNDQELLFQSFC